MQNFIHFANVSLCVGWRFDAHRFTAGTDEAAGIGILFGILFPLLLIAAAITGLVALVYQKPQKRNHGGEGRRLGATQAGRAGGLRDEDAPVLAELPVTTMLPYFAVALPLLAPFIFAYIAIGANADRGNAGKSRRLGCTVRAWDKIFVIRRFPGGRKQLGYLLADTRCREGDIPRCSVRFGKVLFNQSRI